MEQITYGAPGYMDWVAQIPIGKANIKVHFTGGTLTVYGITPSEFTTANEFIQKVIESSIYFKDGRITKLRTVEIDDRKKKQEAGQPEDNNANKVLEKVNVTCLQDAQTFLQERFNIPTYKVRSKVTATSLAEEYGIEFIGL